MRPAGACRPVGRALGLGRGQQAPPAFRLQLDEPSLGMASRMTDEAMRDAAYDGVPSSTRRSPIVTVQFGEASDETARPSVDAE